MATDRENRLLEACSHWMGACYNYACADLSRTVFFFTATQFLKLIQFAYPELHWEKTGGRGPPASRRVAYLELVQPFLLPVHRGQFLAAIYRELDWKFEDTRGRVWTWTYGHHSQRFTWFSK